MGPQDEDRFAKAMMIMGEVFQKMPGDSLFEVYFRALQDMDIGTFEDACLSLINTRRVTGTFPLVAEIREAVSGGESGKVLAATTAWDKLMYAIEAHCPYDSVQFDDPIIFHIVRQWGGWPTMGDWPAEETKWKQKEFEKLYLTYAANKHLPAPDGHLVGLTEKGNRAHWPEFVPKPVLISGTTGAFKSLPFFPSPERKRLMSQEDVKDRIECDTQKLIEGVTRQIGGHSKKEGQHDPK